MKVLTSIQIKDLDRYTIEHEPISSLDLMERAAKALTLAIMERWDKNHLVKVFAGPGNNGGDALAVARMLAEYDYAVEVFLFNTTDKLSIDCMANRDRIRKSKKLVFNEITSQFDPPELTENMLVVDGLFGSGLSRPLSGGFAAVVKYINASPASVVSLDVPSGLFCEDNSSNIASHIIRADLTLTLQFPKLAFFFQDIQQYIGEYQVLDIGLHPDGIEKAPATYFVSSIEEMQKLLKKRDKFAHKGTMGHALLVAGSYGMAGAAVLATRAALRTGLGKITVHTPKRNNDILQIAVPEAILHHDSDDYRFVHPSPTEAYQAVGIGPGLGTMKDTSVAMIEEARRTQCPIVLDADALNILGDHRSWIQQVPTHAILTPHPKEMDRLAGNSTSCYERLAKAITMANSQQFYIVLKGAWTAIVTPEGNVYFNPSGNPGMATAGSGDVLTGIILGLLAQGYTQESAARLGVYLHGLAGDLAEQDLTEEGLTAHDLIDYLPKAWKKLKGI